MRALTTTLPPLPTALLACGLSCAAATGCGGSADEGRLEVLIQAEDTITRGLDPGTGPENLVDGWTARFDKYVVALGNVKLGRDADHIEVTDTVRRAYDLVQAPQADWELTELAGLEGKRYDFFGYETVHAEEAERHPSVSEADFDEMVEHHATYLIEGRISRDAEEVTFRFLVPADTAYGPCEVDGLPGVPITGGGTFAVGLTIHGDHLFFDSFGTHDVERRAQWIADADVDADGHVDVAELRTITGAALSQLLPSNRYALGGWTAFPIETAYDFLRAQLHTQGHFQGEGECVWTVDGVAGGHDHDHDHDHDH
jgi:hypothetical protein